MDFSTITSDAWTEFLCGLCKKDDEAPLKDLPCPLLELFDKQVNIDKAKKDLFKPELDQVLKLYLGRVDFNELQDKIKTHRKNFERGMGKDRLNHLLLLVRLKKLENEKRPRKGLLAV